MFFRWEAFPGNPNLQPLNSYFAHKGILDAARELSLQLDNTSSGVNIKGMNSTCF